LATRNKPVRADISVKNNTYPISSAGGTIVGRLEVEKVFGKKEQ